MNKECKKVLKICLNVFLWLFVAFSVVITVLAFAAQSSSSGVPTLGGKMILTVASDSMKPTFKAGDIITSRAITPEEAKELKVDDVVTYYANLDVNGDGKQERVLNTHRIVEVQYPAEGGVQYVTQGDNVDHTDAEGQEGYVVPSHIVVGKWTGKRIGGFGKFLSFLQTPKGFLVVIVLPLVLFFVYELYVFMRTLIAVKNSGKKQITAADEELIKQRAVEEYLRQQQAANEAAAAEEKAAEEAEAEQPAEETAENGEEKPE